jgi:hypothetical protein
MPYNYTVYATKENDSKTIPCVNHSTAMDTKADCESKGYDVEIESPSGQIIYITAKGE